MLTSLSQQPRGPDAHEAVRWRLFFAGELWTGVRRGRGVLTHDVYSSLTPDLISWDVITRLTQSYHQAGGGSCTGAFRGGALLWVTWNPIKEHLFPGIPLDSISLCERWMTRDRLSMCCCPCSLLLYYFHLTPLSCCCLKTNKHLRS